MGTPQLVVNIIIYENKNLYLAFQSISAKDHGYGSLVVNTSRSFPHSWLSTGFVTRLTRRVSLVKHEMVTFPEHPSSPPVFSGVRDTRSLVLYVCFVDRCLSFCTFSFGNCVVNVLRYADSDYPFAIFKLFLHIDNNRLTKRYDNASARTLWIYIQAKMYGIRPIHRCCTSCHPCIYIISC